jgi:hypothetical protein
MYKARDKSNIFRKFADFLALRIFFCFVKLHKGPLCQYLLTFLLMAERFYFEPFFELNSFFHGGWPRRLGQLHILPVFLVHKMKIFRFISRTHEEIFIHFWVLTFDLLALFLRKVRDVTRIHFDSPFDGGFFFEVLW